MSQDMTCLDSACMEEAKEIETYLDIPIRVCKNGHRTGVFIEPKETQMSLKAA